MKTAVIVDDEPLACELIKNLILNFKLPINVVGQAHSGDEALRVIHETRPDLLFLDIELPVISGIEVMRKLRDYSSPLKVIIITAYGYFEYAQQALRLGAKDILLKPISSVQFIDMIGRVLGSNLTGNKTFNEILEYIDDNLSLNLSLGGLAKMFHTSPNYLTKLFVKYTQKTYTAYINGQRIAKAIELLTQSDLSIKEISEKVGFNSLNYFYKKFSEIAGSTPKTFQRE